jgi:4-amino-4-deoxy-L-arabinose transferase-like glycosyltransferase
MSAIAVSSPVCRDRHAHAWRFPILLTAYLGTLLVLRLLISTTLQWDEAEQTVFSQSLRLGYSEQPPLYTWLTWAVFEVFGPGVLGLAILKTAIFAVIFGMTYRTAARVLGDARLARYAAFSLLVIPYFAWEANRDGTHSLLLAAAVAGTIDAALRIMASGRTWDYAALGAWIGVGVLAKYNAGLCHAAVLAATIMVPAARRRLFDRRLLLTIAVALAVAGPHLVWLVEHREWVRLFLNDRAGVGRPASPVRGLLTLLTESAIMTAPLLILLVLFLPAAFRRSPADAGPSADARRWLGWYLVALTAGLLTCIAAGATRILSHWLPPLVTPLPIYLFLRFQGQAVSRRRLRGYAVALTCAAFAALAMRASLLWVGGKQGQGWHAGRDLLYATVAKHWNPADLNGATIVTDDPNVGGNLRVTFPGARISCTRYYVFDPPPKDAGVIAWTTGDGPPPVTLVGSVPSTASINAVVVPPDRADHRYHTLWYAVLNGPRPRQ